MTSGVNNDVETDGGSVKDGDMGASTLTMPEIYLGGERMTRTVYLLSKSSPNTWLTLNAHIKNHLRVGLSGSRSPTGAVCFGMLSREQLRG